MLLGQFELTLDAKNRLTLPARHREQFAGGVVVAPGIDGCLAIWSAPEWHAWVDRRLRQLDPMSRDARTLIRYVFGRAIEVEQDRQGRIQLAPHLVRHASLERSVVVAGARDHLEVWDAARWSRAMEEAAHHVGDIAEGLARGAGTAAKEVGDDG